MVKPDQLIKRRGKLGLIKVNTDLEGVKTWVQERMGKDIQVGGKIYQNGWARGVRAFDIKNPRIFGQGKIAKCEISQCLGKDR